MNSGGHIYAPDALAKALDDYAAEQAKGKLRAKMRPLVGQVGGAMVSISDPEVAKELAAMPMRKRRVFFGSRKKGHPESVSLAKARAAR